MIRKIREADYEAAIKIVNENWKRVYVSYVNPELISDYGCMSREEELRQDFVSHRLEEYVWDEEGKILALLSFGDTEDVDKQGGFEIWRVYVSKDAQGKGIGKQLLNFAELAAKENGQNEIIIWAFKQNQKALDFYKKAGYQIDKEEYLGEVYQAYGVRLIKKI